MKKNNLKSVLFALLALVLASSCANMDKMIEQGNFDQAIAKSVKKLSGKDKKKEKYVKAAEEAFHKATQQDMRRAKALEAEANPENWVEINRIYNKIAKRQNMIEPLLPLIDKEGYRADFRFVKVEGLIRESKEKAANFYYLEGKRLLSQAEMGDKEAAREAYTNFDRIGTYYNRYKDEDRLMKKAHELGIIYVQFEIKNSSFAILPRDFEREIRRISVSDMESFWRQVHLTPRSNVKYDYNVVMDLRKIDVTPGLVREREYTDEKTIVDGWKYVLDQKGNVLKDSLGNDVKVDNEVVIWATVFEAHQTKSAIVSGELQFFDNRTRRLFHTEAITAEAIFENYAAKFEGDKRALSNESRKRIGNAPLPFPSDEALVLQAADRLKPVIAQKIRRGLNG